MIEPQGHFTEEQIKLGTGNPHYVPRTPPKPKYQIPAHVDFEIIELPNGKLAKLAYGKLYETDLPDLNIELQQIAGWEKGIEPTHTEDNNMHKVIDARKHLKYHYKKAVAMIAPDMANGWNRWSDNILEMFLNERLHKVLWGSGNCGKSAVMGVLLYVKWRVNPSERMVVIASKVMKDAKARVFGYIKEVHTAAPADPFHKIEIRDSAQDKGIYTLSWDAKESKWVINDRGCIVSLPIKVDAKRVEMGANLLGKHPKDRLILAFDECQEIPGSIQNDKIFVNWYTNKRLDVYGWGNPIPVEYHAQDTWDLLFKLGAEKLSIKSIRNKEKEADRTSTWMWNDTFVLHLSMMDSPKDDSDERLHMITRGDGTKEQRLFFLAGKENVEQIAQKISPQSATWYSQVLGFPFVDTTGTRHEAVLSGYMLSKTKDYPLIWRTPTTQRIWFMGVDPAVTGKRDSASVVCGEMGVMVDGRVGIDVHGGKYSRQLRAVENQDFTDTIIECMWELSQRLKIPLKHIGIETHGTGEVIRYAISAHIEQGKWRDSYRRGEAVHIVNPTAAVTDRLLFKSLGVMLPAKEMCADASTEYYVGVRCAVLTRQIFNIPQYILAEFYNRHLGRSGNGIKYKVESKKEMDKRGVHSPDNADALCNMLEVARQNGFGYKYISKHGYQEVYGDEYDREKELQKVGERASIISNMLGISENLSGYFGVKDNKKQRKRKGLFNIDSV